MEKEEKTETTKKFGYKILYTILNSCSSGIVFFFFFPFACCSKIIFAIFPANEEKNKEEKVGLMDDEDRVDELEFGRMDNFDETSEEQTDEEQENIGEVEFKVLGEKSGEEGTRPDDIISKSEEDGEVEKSGEIANLQEDNSKEEKEVIIESVNELEDFVEKTGEAWGNVEKLDDLDYLENTEPVADDIALDVPIEEPMKSWDNEAEKDEVEKSNGFSQWINEDEDENEHVTEETEIEPVSNEITNQDIDEENNQV